jgi:hypothetical protein
LQFAFKERFSKPFPQLLFQLTHIVLCAVQLISILNSIFHGLADSWNVRTSQHPADLPGNFSVAFPDFVKNCLVGLEILCGGMNVGFNG